MGTWKQTHSVGPLEPGVDIVRRASDGTVVQKGRCPVEELERAIKNGWEPVEETK